MTQQHFPRQQTPSTPTRPRTRADAGLMALYRADLDAVRAKLAAHLPPLQREWGTWLRPWPWDWFGTFTFASPVHPEQADKRWRRWVWAIQHNGAPARHGARSYGCAGTNNRSGASFTITPCLAGSRESGCLEPCGSGKGLQAGGPRSSITITPSGAPSTLPRTAKWN